MSATTYEQTSAYGRSTGRKSHLPSKIGNAVMNWLGGIAERSPQGRAAAQFAQLNAMSDAELARLNIDRRDLLERCFGWRAHC